MARARNIKPGFFQNEELAELDPLARIAFAGFWTIADFRGCIEWRPKRIKIAVLPYDECDMETIADALASAGFIARFEVNGKRYIKVLNFSLHQNPHKQEREAGSDIPDLPTPQMSQNQKVDELPNSTGIVSEANVLIPDSPLLIPDSLTPYADQVPVGGIQTNIPKTVKLEAEIKIWLNAIAPVVGAKDLRTLPRRKRWTEVCEFAIREDRSLVAMLDAVKFEFERCRDTPQFLTPENCLQKLQIDGAQKSRAEDLPTAEQKRADRKLASMNMIKPPTMAEEKNNQHPAVEV